MESFIIAGEDKPIFTPEVIMDIASGKCSIKGESYLEEPFKLYEDILGWLHQFAENHSGKPIVLDIELTYINSTSSRAILDLFRGLADMKEAGKNIDVRWRYPEGDDDFNEIREEGEEFIDESGLDIELVSY